MVTHHDHDHERELKENALEHAVTHPKETWEQYGKPFLYAVIFVLAVWAAYNWYTVSKINKHNEQWYNLSAAASPGSYQSVADASSNDAVILLANLRAADMLVAQVATGDDDDATNAASLKDAAGRYQKIIDDKSANTAFKLNAMLGLAVVAEQNKDFNTASTLYNDIQTQAGSNYPGIAAQAKARGDFLSRLNAPVVFAPEVAVEETPAEETSPEAAPAEEAPAEEAAPAEETPATE